MMDKLWFMRSLHAIVILLMILLAFCIVPDSRREQIYRYIRDNPGKSLQQIADAMQLHRSSLNYHLSKLKSNREINLIHFREYPRYFPSNKGISDEEKILLSLIAEDKDHKLFQTFLNNPGISRKKLAAELKLSEETVAQHLMSFKEHSLLSSENHGREVQYTLTPGTIAMYQTRISGEEPNQSPPPR